MSKEEYLEKILDMYNRGQIDGATYDHMVMMADIYSYDDDDEDDD